MAANTLDVMIAEFSCLSNIYGPNDQELVCIVQMIMNNIENNGEACAVIHALPFRARNILFSVANALDTGIWLENVRLPVESDGEMMSDNDLPMSDNDRPMSNNDRSMSNNDRPMSNNDRSMSDTDRPMLQTLTQSLSGMGYFVARIGSGVVTKVANAQYGFGWLMPHNPAKTCTLV